MSRQRRLREIRRERNDRIRRDVLLCADLKTEIAHVLMVAQAADLVTTLLDRLSVGRRARGRRARG